jgi:hypothetical protein
MKLTLLLGLFMSPALVGCGTLPVTGLGNGVYVAVDSHQEDAIEYANKFCNRNGKHIAVAVDDVRSVSYKPTITFEKTDNSSPNSTDSEGKSQSALSVGGGENYAFKFTCG